MSPELRRLARDALLIESPDDKVNAVVSLCALADAGRVVVDRGAALATADVPGRPARPSLVPPRALARRKIASPAGRAALLHAIARIEFNAINLALDAIARFAGMPPDYYLHWLRIAGEEAHHFALLTAHLMVCGYGDFPAHDGLWEMARETDRDALERMALVPRVLEARGLDVRPGIQARLRQAGDAAAADILAVILRDEIGHVATGNRWFRWLCTERGLDPRPTFDALCRQHNVPALPEPINTGARLAAGFTPEELAPRSG